MIDELNPIKLVLNVTLGSNSSVKLQLIRIHKDYVKKIETNDYMYYRNEAAGFIVWGTQDFLFDNRQLRLPDERNISEIMEYTYVFSNDQERYNTLKKMVETLDKWSQYMDYTNDKVYDKVTNNVVLTGDYWYVI